MIINEYDDEISFDDFWCQTQKENRSRGDGSDVINNKEYYTNWSKYHKNAGGFDHPNDGGLEYSRKILNSGDFYEEYHFGLRFSDTTEFS